MPTRRRPRTGNFIRILTIAGAGLAAALILDEAGDIYGTTGGGGDNRSGTVFRLSGTTVQTLYSFCPQAGYADGIGPAAGVIVDSSGDLFGVTQYGGADDGGTVFELTP